MIAGVLAAELLSTATQRSTNKEAEIPAVESKWRKNRLV